MLMGKGVTLRRIERADLWKIWDLHEDNELRLIQRLNPLMTFDELNQKYFELFRGSQDFLIESHEGKLIGICSYWNISWKNRCCDLSLQMFGNVAAPSADAVSTVLKLLFEDLNLNKVKAPVGEEYANEILVMEEMGFTREGRLREHYFYDGQYRDLHMFALRREDYDAWGGISS